MSDMLHIDPSPQEIAALAQQQPAGQLLGYSQRRWREKTRLELGLAADRPIIATGHQTLLWHPGILAKYIVMDVVAGQGNFGRANLIVDQHVDDYGAFDVPIRRRDGSLGVRQIELTPIQQDVPMGLQRPFAAPQPPQLPFADSSVQAGVKRIIAAVNAHADAPNAAVQMVHALSDMMSRWVRPVPHVTATDLGHSSLSRALLNAMAEDPHRCARAYNDAVTQVSEAGIGTLLVRDDYVELPLWRIREDGRRMRAYDNDVQNMLDDPASPPLLPRALFMTALVRLGMCDVFIHGTGGAKYDRAMELWIANWLGVDVGNIAVATVTLRLPLMDEHEHQPVAHDLARAQQQARQAWHDPESVETSGGPGPRKQAMLRDVQSLPRRSTQRKAAFFQMHETLEDLREQHADTVRHAQQRVDRVQQQMADWAIAGRRDWPFPLYPQHMLDALANTPGHCSAGALGKP